MKVSRRGFLKLAGVAGATAVVGAPSAANASSGTGVEPCGLLIDTTKCVGCRGCEVACSEQNGLPAPAETTATTFDSKRGPTTEAYTAVTRSAEKGKDGGARFGKLQCMHCVEPACASACLARALDKTPEGPVVYHANRCLGCRYCMVACPFEIPRFEYDKSVPVIQKCQACYTRAEGPACVSACPSGALKFGKRADLLEEAKGRIYQNPDSYTHHVYGEHEVGGTSVLYLADVSFESFGLRKDLGNIGYPEFTKGALGIVPFVMTLWPPLLMGIYTFAKGREEKLATANASEAKHD